jgi:hypothetical protein
MVYVLNGLHEKSGIENKSPGERGFRYLSKKFNVEE